MKTEVQINSMMLTKLPGKALCFFDLLVNGEIVIKGFKLVDGNSGRFVSMPREKSSKSDDWFDRVQILNSDLKTEIEMIAMAHYNKLLKSRESLNENLN